MQLMPKLYCYVFFNVSLEYIYKASEQCGDYLFKLPVGALPCTAPLQTPVYGLLEPIQYFTSLALPQHQLFVLSNTLNRKCTLCTMALRLVCRGSPDGLVVWTRTFTSCKSLLLTFLLFSVTAVFSISLKKMKTNNLPFSVLTEKGRLQQHKARKTCWMLIHDIISQDVCCHWGGYV